MATQNCKNCGKEFEGNYCPACGEKIYTDRDRSILFLLKETLMQLTSFEGSFFRTLKALFFHPGHWSSDYIAGKRKPYFKPVSLYLLVIVLYLLFPIFRGLNMDMNSYRNHALIGHVAREKIQQKCLSEKINPEELTSRFNAQSQRSSKLLLLLFIPFTAGCLAIFFYRRSKSFFDLWILATEINVFYLLFIFLIFPVLYVYAFQKTGLLHWSDDGIGFVSLMLFAAYCSLTFRYFFHESPFRSLLKGLGVSVMHTLMVLFLYKPLVFFSTMTLI